MIYEVGQLVKLTKDIFEPASESTLAGYLGFAGDTMVIRSCQEDCYGGRAFTISHPHITDNSFYVSIEEITPMLADTPKAKLVGSLHKNHVQTDNKEHWCKEILLYSPNNPGDAPQQRIDVYAPSPTLSVVAEVIAVHDSTGPNGERSIRALLDISKLPHGTRLYAVL